MRAVIAFLALSGCVSQEFYVKSNVTFDRYNRDVVACQTEVTQAIPSNTQVTFDPITFWIYSTDRNDKLRQSAMGICMRDKGYTQVELPYCTKNAVEATENGFGSMKRPNQRLNIQPNSCWVNTNQGESRFYTQPADEPT